MGTKTVYLTIRADLENPDVEKITNDMVDDVIGEKEFWYNSYSILGYNIETEVCGRNDPAMFGESDEDDDDDDDDEDDDDEEETDEEIKERSMLLSRIEVNKK